LENHTWTEIISGIFDTLLRKVVFINENLAYAIKISEYPAPYHVYKTIDGGINWQAQIYYANDVWLSDITFLNDTVGFAIGGDKYDGTENGIIIKTTTGGVTSTEGTLRIETAISIYPNPTTKTLTIQTPQKANIEITNIEGQIIKTFNITNTGTTFDVSGLSGGVYIIKAQSDEGVVVKKFIKE